MPFRYTTRQWSSEVSCSDHKDVQASAMGIDSTAAGGGGHMALLSGRRCTALVSLREEDFGTVMVRLKRDNRWDVTKVSWNPSVPSQLVLASNDKAELISVTPNSLETTHFLTQHTRLVSDLDWSKNTSVLATASFDSFVHLWDARDPRRPCASLSALVAASQVRWSRHDPNVILTAHEGDLKLWDFRQPALPTHYVTAHVAKILSVDWSHCNRGRFVTSSQDCTIKIFELSSDLGTPKHTMKTEVPVWKTRFTPFGDGLVTVILPRWRRNEHSLFLWSTARLDFPVHCFYGHVDVVLDFDWRRRGGIVGEEANYEMLSWGRDQTLRLWHVPPTVQSMCLDRSVPPTKVAVTEADIISETTIGAAAEVIPLEQPQSGLNSSGGGLLSLLVEAQNESEEEDDNNNNDADSVVTLGGSSSRETTPARCSSSSTLSLQQEFQLLNVDTTRHVRVDSLNWTRRSCKFSSTNSDSRLSLKVNFPAGYPAESKVPTFMFGKGTSLDPAQRSHILQALKVTAKQQARRNRGCLEPCLRQLDFLVGSLTQNECTGEDGEAASPPPPIPTDGCFLDDCNVPYPRSSGASFCGNGFLVCFTRPAYQRISTATPRSLSAFGAQMQVEMQMEAYRATQNTSISLPGISAFRHQQHQQQESNSNINNSLKKKGRFRVRRVRTGSADEGDTSVAAASTKAATQVEELQLKHRVRVYDASRLFLFDRTLAKLYLLRRDDNNNPSAICLANASIAAKEGHSERAHLWQVCAQVAKVKDIRDNSNVPWSVHPLGRPMLANVIQHLIRIHDVQMAALLVCIFHTPQQQQHSKNNVSLPVSPAKSTTSCNNNRFWFLQPGALPNVVSADGSSPYQYHTVHSSDLRSKKKHLLLRGLAQMPNIRSETNFTSSNIVSPCYKSNRSNSWSDPYEESGLGVVAAVAAAAVSDEEEEDTLLERKPIYEDLIRCYAQILFNWGMLKERGQVLKHSSISPSVYYRQKHQGLEPSVNCCYCGQKAVQQGAFCRQCRRPAMRCCLCRMAVRGLAARCADCGHGGHFKHLNEWFVGKGRTECPAGCGCRCTKMKSVDKGCVVR